LTSGYAAVTERRKLNQLSLILFVAFQVFRDILNKSPELLMHLGGGIFSQQPLTGLRVNKEIFRIPKRRLVVIQRLNPFPIHFTFNFNMYTWLSGKKVFKAGRRILEENTIA
jgi:hypothetical protein